MSIIAFNVNVTGLVGDNVNPRLNTMITTDNLAKITTAGYLNNQNINGNPVLPTDVFHVYYSFNVLTQRGTFGIFTLTYSITTGYTLVEWANPGDVLLPVVSGDFAVFNGTSGQIKDAGYLPSNAAKTVVPMMNAAVTLNHIAQFADTAGTLKDGGVLGTAAAKAASDNTKPTVASVTAATTSGNLAQFNDTAGTVGDAGIATTDVVVKNAPNTFSGTGSIILPKVPGTEAANAVTANGVAGVITTSSLTTAGGANYAITWTNSAITAASVIMLSIMGGTNTTQDINFKVIPGSGTATLTIYNLTASTNLDGTILIGYLVV